MFNKEPIKVEEVVEERIERSNIGEAHKKALSKKESSTHIPYSQLFGREIDPSEAIDIENEPFGLFEPTAKDLDNFTEAEKLPLEQERLPPIQKTKPKKKKERESEYFEGDKSEEKQEKKEVANNNNESSTKEKPQINTEVANSFLAKLSNLKDDVLNTTRNSVGFGMFYHSRVGSAGLDALDEFVLPALDIHYYYNISHHFYGHANFINMSNGQITGDALQRYGDMKSAGNSESVSSLMELMAGYEYTGDGVVLTGEIGTVPSPAIAPETQMTWLLKVSGKSGKFAYDIGYVNKSMKDSMLSRIGDTYNWVSLGGEDNPDTEENETYQSGTGIRGAISKKGFEFGGKLSIDNEVFAGNLNYYYDISGYNIIPNKEIALTLLYLRLLNLPRFKSFMIGPIFLYDNYTYNSGYFTVGKDGKGNGGYFSPKNFILLGLYFDFAQILNEKLFWKIKGNVGVMRFTSGKDMFDDTSNEMEVSGYGYEAKGFVGYKIDNSIQILGGVGYQSSGPYQSLFFGLTAIYYFGEKKSNTISDLMYSNTIGEMAK